MAKQTDATNSKAAPSGDRARMLLSLYVQMGPRRSLARLHQQLQTFGVRLSLATLKRYSARYGWQSEIASISAAAREGQRKAAIAELTAMNDRHGQLARALQGAGGSALQRLLGSDARLANLKPGDIARLIELGLKAERQALAEVSDRHEMAVAVWNVVVADVVEIFTEVNAEPDPGMRVRSFARSVDRLVDKRLGELKRGSGNGH